MGFDFQPQNTARQAGQQSYETEPEYILRAQGNRILRLTENK